MIVRRIALTGFLLGTGFAAVAFALAFANGGAPAAATWLMIAASALMMSSCVILGAAPPGHRSAWSVVAALFVLITIGAVLGAAQLRGPDSADALLLGLPTRLALIVYGIGVLPVVVLPLAYALDFPRSGLDPDSLSALRDQCQLLRADHVPGA